jgi:hypothetical protein
MNPNASALFKQLLSKDVAPTVAGAWLGKYARENASSGDLLTELVRIARANLEFPDSIAAAKLFAAMTAGACRSGRVIAVYSHQGIARAKVSLQTDVCAWPVIPDADLSRSLRCGDAVFLDSQAVAVLARDDADEPSGPHAEFVRCIAGRNLVELSEDGRRVSRLMSDPLRAAIDAGTISAGSSVIVNGPIAVAPVPDQGKTYRYLVQEPPPSVSIDDLADTGGACGFVQSVLRDVRIRMLQPDLCRQYRRRGPRSIFLTGPSGTGKTYSIYALWRGLYDVMANETGATIDDLPARVFRVRMPDVLSKWLGETDKQIDLLFGEAEDVAGQIFRGPDGRDWQLPVLVILEEFDALGRSRLLDDHDGIFQRIMATVLQRLDVARPELADKHLLFVGTTNVPQLVDAAILRRLGGQQYLFRRLTQRRSFMQVLAKHLRGVPLAAHSDRNGQALEAAVVEVADWLFHESPHQPLVQLTFAGGNTQAVSRHQFLTHDLVRRAVEAATDEALRRHFESGTKGLHIVDLIRAFADQTNALADTMTPQTATDFVDLPDSPRVTAIQRLAHRTPSIELRHVR